MSDFCSPVVDHGVVHHIPTTGTPLHSNARRLSPDKLTVAREVFDNMLHHLFTWFQRQTSHGGPVETTGASTMRQYPTGICCLTNKTQRQQDTTSPVNFLVFSNKLFTTPNQPSWMTRIHLRRLPSGREEVQRRFLLRDQSVHYIFGGRCFNNFFFLSLLFVSNRTG